MNSRLGFHNKQMLRGTDLIPTNCDCESSFTDKIITGNMKRHISQDMRMIFRRKKNERQPAGLINSESYPHSKKKKHAHDAFCVEKQTLDAFSPFYLLP